MFRTLLLISSLVPALAFADTFYIEEAPRNSVALSAVEGLIENELKAKGHIVVDNKKSSQWVLSPGAIKLDESYIVTLEKSKDGKPFYSGRLKSVGLEELDIVTERLVSAAIASTAADRNITVDTITENEVKGTSVKTKVERQTFLGYGPSRLTNLDTSNSAVSFSAGALWNIDHQYSIRAGFSTNSASDSPAGIVDLTIGGNYYLSRERHSSYVVGLLSHARAQSHSGVADSRFTGETETNSGWGLEAGVGMHFFRTAAANMSAEMTYKQAFFKLADKAPGSLGMRLVIHW